MRTFTRPQRGGQICSTLMSLLTVIALIVSVIAVEGSSVAVEQSSALTADAKQQVGQSAPTPTEPQVKDPLAPADKPSEAKSEAPIQEASDSAADSAGKRKARSGSDSAPETKTTASQKDEKSDPAAAAQEKAPGEKAAPSSAAAPATKSETKPQAAGSQQKSGKPSAGSNGTKSGTKSKLPANLGTVTSTGSGGPAHYMSKHDAYSAIAEKHGALAQDAMRKSDRRQLQASFGGIQKASGLGDVFGSPFKGVTDSGLARTLGASMRSIMKSKYSVPAYVASALLGAVALMAFYESPISPLPVPPLPEPPVGRFPPEMPNISPNVQVPFRANQMQQNYNQRSLVAQLGGYQQAAGGQQQQQQVLFPGATGNGAYGAQQRQLTVGAGPVQQLAANLIGKAQQNAQRKSSPDYEQPSSRSLFGSSLTSSSSPSAALINSAQGKLSAPANQAQQRQSSFLSYFGLGGQSSGSSSPSAQALDHQQQQQAHLVNFNPASQFGQLAGQLSSSASSLVESKGQSSGLSNSHLVNKVKSFLGRSPTPSATSSSSSIAHSNSSPLDQYQRMSFVQALMKDTAFLPGFFTPTRKSSPSQSVTSSSPSSSSQAAPQSGGQQTARMQVASESVPNNQANSKQQQQQQQLQQKSGYGLARLAHALLETFSSGVVQQRSAAGQHADSAARKSNDDSSAQSSLASATSLIGDIMSSYGSSISDSSANSQQQQQHYEQQSGLQSQAQPGSHHQQPPQQQQQQPSQQQAAGSGHSQADTQASGRSMEEPMIITAEPDAQQQVASAAPPAQENATHIRKTRSIGFEYPLENNQELVQREQQPSRAAQINNVIDFVADSYTQNRLLFNFVMNQVGLSQAVPYVEQILAPSSSDHHH